MGWNSSRHWQHRRHRGNGWLIPVVVIGLIILTHGWILFLPLMVLAGFLLFGVLLPKVLCSAQGNMGRGGHWAWTEEKRKRFFETWDGEKPKRHDPDRIDYV